MKRLIYLFAVLALVRCQQAQNTRETLDFNQDWQFYLGTLESPQDPSVEWKQVDLPHDWSIREGYKEENTAASTGFVPGGVGWYRKTYTPAPADAGKVIRLEFDGVYCNSQVWINGQLLGFRPNGYSSFAYDLTVYVNVDEPNEIVVNVDHSAYADTRWYTGSGIYRDVRLVKLQPTHVAHWGVRVNTSEVSSSSANVNLAVQLNGASPETTAHVTILNDEGLEVASKALDQDGNATIKLDNPKLWDLESPHLYDAVVKVYNGEELVDEKAVRFGVRDIAFTADRGFLLNGKQVKIKGVNLHHDAGALGAAVPRSAWEYRVRKLQSIGVNAIRMSHNPHSVDLLDLCDELGVLVMDEFFDEWHVPKGKNLNYIGDNAAKGELAAGYSEYFHEWAERDLKDLIRRDYNHPSVIMWSIGNEIEWTFPDYSKAYHQVNQGINAYGEAPNFDPETVKAAFDEVTQGKDTLATVAQQLAAWVRELDTTRAITCGSVRPSVAAVSGYADAVDVLGFNYRQMSYDAAHETYPDMKIIGSENWGDYTEWKAVNSRDFVAGMFAWTGFAYLGEAGPWPRKGLEIAFFDYAGFKTPRGHFFETLWVPAPKTYMVVTPASKSEYSFDPEKGWQFEFQLKKAPIWPALRRWEWYQHVEQHWNFEENQDMIVQVYTNAEEVELFLNERSLGKQALADFADDNIIKWLVPYASGTLKAIGYSSGKQVSEYTLTTAGSPSVISLDQNKNTYEKGELAFVTVQLMDAAGQPVRHVERSVSFEVTGGELIAVDNGSEYNVENHYKSSVTTSLGRALAIVRVTDPGTIQVSARGEGLASASVVPGR
ncbi:glycoside hydrolase family 2 TIM barrel-domain containing protein [Marinoscillum furvescens]|uniref:Glycosyl hydrolase family 2 n=1 Tax=Marinoscillum furvescens DSM 4134 TaxID=1122208 RepID=A0A3D9L410_MARFU|nr:glycoside hydrolase family 2 TIM barrel-domain containing protein [Marinoscillum furvescens]REE00201.1 glycosyl hydrolase family 2 [Marinoscillum furvescens DSM 4134]